VVRAWGMRGFPRRDVGKPSSILGGRVPCRQSGDFRDRRSVAHRGEFRCARIQTTGRWPFPWSRHGLGPSLAGWTDLRGPSLSALPEGTGWCRPLLAFASCVDSVAASLAHLPPKGLAVRVHARPLPSEDCRAVVPSHQRSIRRCRAPGGAAGGQVPHPSPKGGKSPTRGPAGVSRVPCFGVLARHTLRCRGLSTSASTPGIVDSSLASRPVVQEALRRRSSPTRPGREGPPQAVVHEESCRTPLMGGLKDCPSVDIRARVHSQLAAVLDRTRCPPRWTGHRCPCSRPASRAAASCCSNRRP
jgi:hypothetical protein